MEQQYLRSFNVMQLKKIEKVREKYGPDPFQSFWNELERVLKCKQQTSNEWKRMEKDAVVLGDVGSQSIGEFYYKHTVHKFSYLYVASQGLAIGMHGHNEPANRGKQIRKVKEWYIFPDGIIHFCDKDEKHQLVNSFGYPIYVLSVKVCKKGTR